MVDVVVSGQSQLVTSMREENLCQLVSVGHHMVINFYDSTSSFLLLENLCTNSTPCLASLLAYLPALHFMSLDGISVYYSRNYTILSLLLSKEISLKVLEQLKKFDMFFFICLNLTHSTLHSPNTWKLKIGCFIGPIYGFGEEWLAGNFRYFYGWLN